MELSTKVVSKLVDMSQKEFANKIDSVKLRGDMRNMCFQPFYSNDDILKEKVKLTEYYDYLVDNICAEDCGIVFKSENLMRSMFESFFSNQNVIFSGDLLQLRNDFARNMISDGPLLYSLMKDKEAKENKNSKGVKSKIPADMDAQLRAILGNFSVPSMNHVMPGKMPLSPIGTLPVVNSDVSSNEFSILLDDIHEVFKKELGVDFDLSDSIIDKLKASKLKSGHTDVMKRYASKYCIDNLTASGLSVPWAFKRVLDIGTPFSCQYYCPPSEVLLNTDWFDKAWEFVLESDKNAGRVIVQLPEKRREKLKKLAFNNMLFSSLTCRSFLAVKYKNDFEEALEQAKYILPAPVSRETYEDTAFGLFVDIIKHKISSDELQYIERSKKYWGTHTFTRIMTTEYDGADIARFIDKQRNISITDYISELSENQFSFSDGMLVSLGNLECCIVPCEHEVVFMLRHNYCDEVYTENPYLFTCCMILTRDTLASFKSTTNTGLLNNILDFVSELSFDKVIKDSVVFSDTMGNMVVWDKNFSNYVIDYDFLSIPEVQCVCQKVMTPTHSCKLSKNDVKGVPMIIDTDPAINLYEAIYESLKKGNISEVSVLTNHINKSIVMGIFSEFLNLGYCMNRTDHVNRCFEESETFEITENINGVIPKYDRDGYAVLLMDKKYADSLNSSALSYEDIKNSDDNDFASFVESINKGSKKNSKKSVIHNDNLSSVVGLRTKLSDYYDDYSISNSIVPVVLNDSASLDYLKKDFLSDAAKLGIPYVDIRVMERGLDFVSSFTLTTKDTEVARIGAYYPIVNPVITVRAYMLLAIQGSFHNKSCIFNDLYLTRGTFEYKYAALAVRMLLLEMLSNEDNRIKFFDAVTYSVNETLKGSKKSAYKDVTVTDAQIVEVLSEFIEDIKRDDFLSDSILCDLLVNVFATMVYNKTLYISDMDYTKLLYSTLPEVSDSQLSGVMIGNSLGMLLGLCAEDSDDLSIVKSSLSSVMSNEWKESLDSYVFTLLGAAVADKWDCDIISETVEDSSLDNVQEEIVSTDTVVEDVVEVSSIESVEVNETVDSESIEELSVEEKLASITFRSDFDRILQRVSEIGVEKFKDASVSDEEIDYLRLEFKRLVEISPKSKEYQATVKIKLSADAVALYISLVSDKSFCKLIGVTANREYLRYISKYLKSVSKN